MRPEWVVQRPQGHHLQQRQDAGRRRHHLFDQPASRRRLEVRRGRPDEADQGRRQDGRQDQVKIVLEAPDADLPYVLSDYHVLVVPKDFTDWANPVGTGGYKAGSIRARRARDPDQPRRLLEGRALQPGIGGAHRHQRRCRAHAGAAGGRSSTSRTAWWCRWSIRSRRPAISSWCRPLPAITSSCR